MVAAVGAGLAAAALRVGDHTAGTAEVLEHSRGLSDRLLSAVEHAALVRDPSGGPPRPGVWVLDPAAGDDPAPGGGSAGGAGGFAGGPAYGERLLVWCGGRGFAGHGGAEYLAVQQRRPRAEELLIFTTDPGRPWRLVEAWPRGVTGEIDVWSADLPARVDALLRGDLEPVTLSDRVRVRSAGGGRSRAGCVRFTIHATPTDDQLAEAAADPDPPAARAALPWAGGRSGPDPDAAAWGLRTVRVRADTQLVILESQRHQAEGTAAATEAVPFTASAARVDRHTFE